MADNEQKAMQLIAEAEKKLNSSKGFLGSLFGYEKQKVFRNFHLIKKSWKEIPQLNFLFFYIFVLFVRICFSHISILK